MEPSDRTRFLDAYRKLLTRSWSDPAFDQRLRRDPERALAECGLQVPPDASVQVVAISDVGWGDLDGQIRSWEQGVSTGHYKLYLTQAPPIETAELSETELANAAGGVDAGGGFQTWP